MSKAARLFARTIALVVGMYLTLPLAVPEETAKNGIRPGQVHVDEVGEGSLPVIVPELAVGAQRHPLLEVLDGADAGEVVVLAEARAGRLLDQPAQRAALRQGCVLARQLVEPHAGVGADQRGAAEAAAPGAGRAGGIGEPADRDRSVRHDRLLRLPG